MTSSSPRERAAGPIGRRDFLGVALLAAAASGGGASRALSRALGLQEPRVDGARLNRTLAELSAFGRNDDGGIDRVAYSEADRAGREYAAGLMRTAGLGVRIDMAGNLIGRREGREAALPAIVFGSHLDSVPGGGNYDGQVGSMGAIEVARTLADQRVTTRHPLELILFQNEENGKIGSRAIRGEDPALYLDLMTHSGRTVREGIRFLGGDPDRLAEAKRAPGSLAVFFELHIEQGDVLDRMGVQIGIVEGIVGIKRWLVTVEGFANHAGTTPMDRRQDALLAAARFIDAANRIVTAIPGRQVATVGTISAEPGAPNVIAGRATLTLEMRDLDLAKVDRLFETMRAEGEAIGRATGTRFAYQEIYRTLPADADERMRALIEGAARRLGYSTTSLPSGAGHDAQEMATLAPMGMIFVPSVGGISHSPKELTRPEDVERGANVLLHVVLEADRTL